MTTKPRIELRNVKRSAFASEETHCYEATLYVDGVRIGKVGNDGHGGPDHFDGDWKVYREIDERVKATYPARECFGETFPESLESLCCELVNTHIATRDLRAKLAKTVLAKTPAGQIVYWRMPPDAISISQAKQRYPDHLFLNELPFDDALKIWMEST